ncbi:MAG: hypothetical protein ACKVOJ_04160 [Sphingomonadaceae bacterium]
MAAAIIAAMLGVTFQAVTASAQQSRMIEDRRLALLVAQSQMSAADARASTSFGETRGVTGTIEWRVTISPYQAGTNASVPLELVTVSAGRGERGVPLVTLRTLRIVA